MKKTLQLFVLALVLLVSPRFSFSQCEPNVEGNNLSFSQICGTNPPDTLLVTVSSPGAGNLMIFNLGGGGFTTNATINCGAGTIAIPHQSYGGISNIQGTGTYNSGNGIVFISYDILTGGDTLIAHCDGGYQGTPMVAILPAAQEISISVFSDLAHHLVRFSPGAKEEFFNGWNLFVLDVSGREIFSTSEITIENYSLDYSQMQTGIYFYQISVGNKSASGKFLVH